MFKGSLMDLIAKRWKKNYFFMILSMISSIYPSKDSQESIQHLEKSQPTFSKLKYNKTLMSRLNIKIPKEDKAVDKGLNRQESCFFMDLINCFCVIVMHFLNFKHRHEAVLSQAKHTAVNPSPLATNLQWHLPYVHVTSTPLIFHTSEKWQEWKYRCNESSISLQRPRLQQRINARLGYLAWLRKTEMKTNPLLNHQQKDHKDQAGTFNDLLMQVIWKHYSEHLTCLSQ